MTNEIRAAIVFLCTCIQDDMDKRALYDFEQRKYYHYHLIKDSIQYSLYDYERRSYVQGNMSQCFDTKSRSYIFLKFENDRFMGFDRRSGSYIYGNINGNLIMVYDTQKSRYLHYTII